LVDRIDEAIEAALRPTKNGLDAADSDPDRIQIRPEIDIFL